MQTILEIARQLKYLPQESDLPKDTNTEEDLTDEESKAALTAARRAKYFAGESDRYWKRVKQLTEIPALTSEQFYKMILLRAQKEIRDFVLDENQIIVYKLLSQYFTKDKLFEEGGFSFKKGIALFGGVGCGKTTIMKMFVHNPLHSYVVTSCRQIASAYAKDGPPAIHRYSGIYEPTMVENPFQTKSWGICFDDLGTESDKKHFGNELNVMENILLNRYDSFNTLHSRTHLTTNLTPAETEEQYGTRVRSRMREMFNLISVTGEDLRK